MKKHISLLLAVIMLASLFSVFSASAEGTNVASLTVNGNTTEYATVSAAVTAANNAGSDATLTLLKDCSTSATLEYTAANALTIVGGDYTLTNAGTTSMIKLNGAGTLNIVDGTFSTANARLMETGNCTGTLNIFGGSFVNTLDNANNGFMTTSSNSASNVTVNIYDGYFYASGTQTQNLFMLYYGNYNIFGGTFSAPNNTSKSIIRARTGASLKIYGGSFTIGTAGGSGNDYSPIHIDDNIAATISGATVCGGNVGVRTRTQGIQYITTGQPMTITMSTTTSNVVSYSRQNTTGGTMGSFDKTDIGVQPLMQDGASIRLVENSNGIRFTTDISKATLDYIKAIPGYQADSISYGTLLTLTSNVTGAKAFSHASLDYNGSKYLDLTAADGLTENDDGSVSFRAAIVGMDSANYGTQMSAISYIEATINGQTVYFYSTYVEQNNARSIKQVAEIALDTDFDEYDDNEIALLKGYAGRS